MKRWELARLTLSAAEAAYYNGEEGQWMLLFKWAALNYSPERSPRQKEIQRLWQQRGLLERTKANIIICIGDTSLQWTGPSDKGFLSSARAIIQEQIECNIEAMGTVKKRIPA